MSTLHSIDVESEGFLNQFADHNLNKPYSAFPNSIRNLNDALITIHLSSQNLLFLHRWRHSIGLDRIHFPKICEGEILRAWRWPLSVV
jgi:hypothetical protein